MSKKPAMRHTRVDRLDPRREAEYIIGKAQEIQTCVVICGALVFFSTAAGDAWMLDPEDKFALCLARDGDPQPFRMMEMADGGCAVEWNADYDIDANAFVVMERSGRMRTILGYPMREIEKMSRDAHG